jgi:hypothetical protein
MDRPFRFKLGLSKAGSQVFASNKTYFEEIIDKEENKKLERRHSSYISRKLLEPPKVVRRQSYITRTTGASIADCARIAHQKELQEKVIHSKAALADAKAALRKFSDTEHTPAKTAAREEYARAECEVEDACREWFIGMR